MCPKAHLAFQASAIGHSAISPKESVLAARTGTSCSTVERCERCKEPLSIRPVLQHRAVAERMGIEPYALRRTFGIQSRLPTIQLDRSIGRGIRIRTRIGGFGDRSDALSSPYRPGQYTATGTLSDSAG